MLSFVRPLNGFQVGLKDPNINRPIAAMPFSCLTRVGKAELENSSAACYVGSVRFSVVYMF